MRQLIVRWGYGLSSGDGGKHRESICKTWVILKDKMAQKTASVWQCFDSRPYLFKSFETEKLAQCNFFAAHKCCIRQYEEDNSRLEVLTYSAEYLGVFNVLQCGIVEYTPSLSSMPVAFRPVMFRPCSCDSVLCNDPGPWAVLVQSRSS